MTNPNHWRLAILNEIELIRQRALLEWYGNIVSGQYDYTQRPVPLGSPNSAVQALLVAGLIPDAPYGLSGFGVTPYGSPGTPGVPVGGVGGVGGSGWSLQPWGTDGWGSTSADGHPAWYNRNGELIWEVVAEQGGTACVDPLESAFSGARAILRDKQEQARTLLDVAMTLQPELTTDDSLAASNSLVIAGMGNVYASVDEFMAGAGVKTFDDAAGAETLLADFELCVINGKVLVADASGNLRGMRELVRLLDGSTTAVRALHEPLSVVFTREHTVVSVSTPCNPAGESITVTEVLGYNRPLRTLVPPAELANVTAHVFWMREIKPSRQASIFLQAMHLSDEQVDSALAGASDAATRVQVHTVVDPGIVQKLLDYGLTIANIDELFARDFPTGVDLTATATQRMAEIAEDLTRVSLSGDALGVQQTVTVPALLLVTIDLDDLLEPPGLDEITALEVLVSDPKQKKAIHGLGTLVRDFMNDLINFIQELQNKIGTLLAKIYKAVAYVENMLNTSYGGAGGILACLFGFGSIGIGFEVPTELLDSLLNAVISFVTMVQSFLDMMLQMLVALGIARCLVASVLGALFKQLEFAFRCADFNINIPNPIGDFFSGISDKLSWVEEFLSAVITALRSLQGLLHSLRLNAEMRLGGVATSTATCSFAEGVVLVQTIRALFA